MEWVNPASKEYHFQHVLGIIIFQCSSAIYCATGACIEILGLVTFHGRITPQILRGAAYLDKLQHLRFDGKLLK